MIATTTTTSVAEVATTNNNATAVEAEAVVVAVAGGDGGDDGEEVEGVERDDRIHRRRRHLLGQIIDLDRVHDQGHVPLLFRRHGLVIAVKGAETATVTVTVIVVDAEVEATVAVEAVAEAVAVASRDHGLGLHRHRRRGVEAVEVVVAVDLPAGVLVPFVTDHGQGRHGVCHRQVVIAEEEDDTVVENHDHLEIDMMIATVVPIEEVGMTARPFVVVVTVQEIVELATVHQAGVGLRLHLVEEGWTTGGVEKVLQDFRCWSETSGQTLPNGISDKPSAVSDG
mmetsp:Transcript_37659/g.91598  ORF Transcript_37659/g.91598 Transcript_37659/m.91598 type:complete len:283 (+) Transcript_37659:494-1342(+)